MANDIIIDTLDTLIALLQANGGVFLPGHRSEAERIARAAWAGDRPYIPKLGESGQMQISQRDRSIRRDFAHGSHIGLLARRHGLSERRVREIVQADRIQPAPPDPVLAADCLIGRSATVQPTQQRQAKRADPA